MAGPLSSLKVLDFSTLLPGPFGTMVLADLGAEVLRVESPTRPDMVRMLPPYDNGQSAVHGYLNRSKRSLALDLKKPGAKEIIFDLVKEYDIVVEQFRPGVMARLGVGYEELAKHNPALIYCAITGYGQDGPYQNRAGHDLNYLAIAGVGSYNGRKSTGPAPMAVQVADIAGGSAHAVMGILAAVIHRQQTGEGQMIDISMTDAAFSLHGLVAPNALIEGKNPELEETQLNGGSFYDYYQTKDGRWLSVAGLEPQFFVQFCQAIGKPELANQGLSMDPESVAKLKASIKEAIAADTFDHWQQVFAEVDACVEPVLSITEAAQHPQLVARGMTVQVPNGAGGEQTQVASPIKFSRCALSYKYVGVALGAHNQEVFEELGYSGEQVAALKKQGVVS